VFLAGVQRGAAPLQIGALFAPSFLNARLRFRDVALSGGGVYYCKRWFADCTEPRIGGDFDDTGAGTIGIQYDEEALAAGEYDEVLIEN
jgi:hypothetical protein